MVDKMLSWSKATTTWLKVWRRPTILGRLTTSYPTDTSHYPRRQTSHVQGLLMRSRVYCPNVVEWMTAGWCGGSDVIALLPTLLPTAMRKASVDENTTKAVSESHDVSPLSDDGFVLSTIAFSRVGREREEHSLLKLSKRK